MTSPSPSSNAPRRRFARPSRCWRRSPPGSPWPAETAAWWRTGERESIPWVVHRREQRRTQSVGDLIGNAVEHLPPRCPDIQIEITRVDELSRSHGFRIDATGKGRCLFVGEVDPESTRAVANRHRERRWANSVNPKSNSTPRTITGRSVEATRPELACRNQYLVDAKGQSLRRPDRSDRGAASADDRAAPVRSGRSSNTLN